MQVWALFHISDLQALLTGKLQILAVLSFTNDCRLQIAENLRVPQGSHMLMRGSQVWCLF